MTGPATRILAGLLEARTGQKLSPARSWRVETALRPLLRELGLASIDPLAARIAAGRDEALATRVVELLLNNESSFFRDMSVFNLLDREALEAIRRARARERRLRIWSAGCSTGQEAYTLAILLSETRERWAGWTIDLVATDISAFAIARARGGRYSQFEIQRGLPARTMLRWFTQDGEEWPVDPALKRIVRFGVHNVFDPPPGRFDVVLCRNVMMYFAPAARAKVFDRLAAALDGDGVLMLGAGETVIGQTDRFTAHPELRGLYAPADRTGAQSRAAA
ncbi:MAG: protein-glutamate O-methyltransferase CheR [Sphingomonadaceae bacterium]|nr:protein-glutamate O-methyltransferase CheR [Sphingomonadaceae bacterium]